MEDQRRYNLWERTQKESGRVIPQLYHPPPQHKVEPKPLSAEETEAIQRLLDKEIMLAKEIEKIQARIQEITIEPSENQSVTENQEQENTEEVEEDQQIEGEGENSTEEGQLPDILTIRPQSPRIDTNSPRPISPRYDLSLINRPMSPRYEDPRKEKVYRVASPRQLPQLPLKPPLSPRPTSPRVQSTRNDGNAIPTTSIQNYNNTSRPTTSDGVLSGSKMNSSISPINAMQASMKYNNTSNMQSTTSLAVPSTTIKSVNELIENNKKYIANNNLSPRNSRPPTRGRRIITPTIQNKPLAADEIACKGKTFKKPTTESVRKDNLRKYFTPPEVLNPPKIKIMSSKINTCKLDVIDPWSSKVHKLQQEFESDRNAYIPQISTYAPSSDNQHLYGDFTRSLDTSQRVFFGLPTF